MQLYLSHLPLVLLYVRHPASFTICLVLVSRSRPGRGVPSISQFAIAVIEILCLKIIKYILLICIRLQRDPFSRTVRNSSSFATLSLQLILCILVQHLISYFPMVRVSHPQRAMLSLFFFFSSELIFLQNNRFF